MKNLYDQPINSDIKRCEETRNLRNTTGYLSDYEYVKHLYKLIVVDLF